MNKDELKNRISMSLKDPILHQGFEVICKENAELKIRLNAINLLIPELERSLKLRRQQLDRAKEIIRNLIDSLIAVDGEQVRELKTVKEAEQFFIEPFEKVGDKNDRRTN